MDRGYWFDRKEKKFLHNIDTFYYSIKLHNDLTRNSQEAVVERFRRLVQRYQDTEERCTPFTEVPYRYSMGYSLYSHGASNCVNYRHGTFDAFYNFILEVPGRFEVAFAPIVPPAAGGVGSITSEIVVMIRSQMLWELGTNIAFEQSYAYVQELCTFFQFDIAEVKENRTDFCWHTNALQDPENYFRIDRLSEMQVSRFRGVNYHYKFKPTGAAENFQRGKVKPGRKPIEERWMEDYGTVDDIEKSYEWDYLCFGQRGDKCFLRVYLKTKEVVEMGYKGWFLKLWQLQGLISRYDLYVLEKAYEKRRWNYCDLARLQFALENDNTLSDADRSLIRATMEEERPDYAKVHRLAKRYTPELTKVINVEFQTMRSMTRTFELVPIRDNMDKGATRRVYDFLANRKIITDYLTHDTFRLVRRKDGDRNKWRADYTDFWKRLRNTKQVDVLPNKHHLKLIRNYASKLNLEMRKTRAVNAVSSFALSLNRNPASSIYEDAAELLAVLNDNDFARIYRYKHIKVRGETDDPLQGYGRQRHITIIDDGGEFYDAGYQDSPWDDHL